MNPGAELPPDGHRPRWLPLITVAFVVHLLFCAQRLPLKALPARLESVAQWWRVGPVAYHLRDEPLASMKAVDFLVANTAEDCVVLFAGEFRGALELANALLAPRMLYDEAAVPPGASSVHGRPLARVRLEGRVEGVVVLESTPDSLRLRLR